MTKNQAILGIAALSLVLSTGSAIYARLEHIEAARIRVAACQMLPDRKSWDDFECSKAFKAAQDDQIFLSDDVTDLEGVETHET